ncbi:uncharacterized protein TNCV_2477551 [Trichonephila clavipes]|nr:uncharacterized protein TNCV_2477551 [Trichonephila clavipes]
MVMWVQSPIMADKDILESVQSSKNIIDTDFDDENEVNNATLVLASFEMSNITKICHQISVKTVAKRRKRYRPLYLMLYKGRYKTWIPSNEALFHLSFTTGKTKIQYISSKKHLKDAAVLKNGRQVLWYGRKYPLKALTKPFFVEPNFKIDAKYYQNKVLKHLIKKADDRKRRRMSSLLSMYGRVARFLFSLMTAINRGGGRKTAVNSSGGLGRREFVELPSIKGRELKHGNCRSFFKQINLEVDSDDIQELPDSYNKELTMDELTEMHEQDIEELQSLD